MVGWGQCCRDAAAAGDATSIFATTRNYFPIFACHTFLVRVINLLASCKRPGCLESAQDMYLIQRACLFFSQLTRIFLPSKRRCDVANAVRNKLKRTKTPWHIDVEFLKFPDHTGDKKRNGDMMGLLFSVQSMQLLSVRFYHCL